MRIKIKQLPSILFKEIKDTDFVVVENKDDTYKSTIADMKNVFSCDYKIDALAKSINEALIELEKIIDENKEMVYEDIDKIKNTLDSINNNVNSITSRLKTAEKEIKNHSDQISQIQQMNKDQNEVLDSINLTLDDHLKRVESLERDNANNKDRISTLEKLTESHTTAIDKLDKELSDYKSSNDNHIGNMDNIINQNYTALDKKIEEKYMELLDIIDEYHHMTHE